MASVILVDDAGHETVVSTPRNFVTLVYGNGLMPLTGTIPENYAILVDGLVEPADPLLAHIRLLDLTDVDSPAYDAILDMVASVGGVTDHGALTGLADDDHPQYLNQARGDARYTQDTDPRLAEVAGATSSATVNTLAKRDAAGRLAVVDGAAAGDAVTKGQLDLKAPLASPTFTGTVSGVTKAMVGLGSVDNTADTAKPVSTAQQTALNLKANAANPVFTGTVTIPDGALAIADTSGLQTALDAKAPLASPTFTGTVSGVTKAMVGLGSVDNTADTAKPVSTAQQTALNGKANTTHTHVATTDLTATGTKDTTTFLRGDNTWAVPAGGGGGWTAVDASETVKGIAEIATAAEVATGTDDLRIVTPAKLKTPMDLKAPLASPTFTGTVSGVTKAMVGLSSVDNTADTAKPVSTAQQIALDLKAPLASPTFTGTVSGVTKTHVGLGSVDNTADTAKPVSTAQQTALNLKANAANPVFTGTVTIPDGALAIADTSGLQTALDSKPTATGITAMTTITASAYAALGGGVSATTVYFIVG